MNPELALRRDQQLQVRKFLVAMRCKMPIAIVDAYYDHEGRALCPTVAGISHHIGPGGDIEPCPVIQFAVENIFPSQVNYYAYNSLATIEGENSSKAEIRNVKVSVFVPGYMNLPSEQIVPKVDRIETDIQVVGNV